MKSQNITQMQVTQIVEKLHYLSPERIREVEDFIDFLKQREEDRNLTQAAMATSEDAFKRVWDNPEDAEYDKL
jgi:hypothetical protein